MDVEEENWRGQVAEEMGFGKNPEYPCLNIDSDSQEMDSQGIMEKNAIFASLFQQNLIGLYKSHSAYEQVGLTFVYDSFEPALDDLFRNFKPSLQFYFCLRNFRLAKVQREYPMYQIYWYFWKFYKFMKIYASERS